MEEVANTNRGRRGTRREFAYLRGYIALRRGQVDAAIESFKEAIRQAPLIWTADSKDCLANAYLELGRLDEAIIEYERILNIPEVIAAKRRLSS